ncbi:MAG: DUF4276 family protein [bacterium]|nr:DUF4276 family protein [bacterium]
MLLVEGDGDRTAVPELVRRVCHHLGLHQIQPAAHPIRCGSIPKLRRAGVVERFVTYACQRGDGDSVLLVLDCDDDCPAEAAAELVTRVAGIGERFGKKVGIAFFHREFETLFLFSVASISSRFPDCGWQLKPFDQAVDMERFRGAKERLRQLMSAGKYKETRDQVRFVTALDLDRLAEKSRSYRHFEAMMVWLCSPLAGGPWIYPATS